MWQYIVRRSLFAIPTVLGITIIVFALTFLTPGDVVLSIMGLDPEAMTSIDKKEVERIRHELGFDLPPPVQYLRWLKNLLQGDLGRSYVLKYPVSELILRSLPITIPLAFGTMLLAAALGVPLGMLSATRRHTMTDNISRVLSILGVSLPVFWEALLLILLFAVIWPIFPISGTVADKGWKAIILPCLAIATHPAALIARMTRSSMLEVLGLDYIRTAHAKGLPSGRIHYIHALRNACIPVVTVMGIQFGSLLGGAVVVEKIFALPGLGTLMLESIYSKDFILTQGCILVIALIFVGANLVVDILYSILDPRIQYRKA
jgi:peptide/nickel transport system permease protein